MRFGTALITHPHLKLHLDCKGHECFFSRQFLIVVTLAWTLVVFLAITGFGAVFFSSAGIGVRKVSPGLCAIAGFGVSLFLGGILNAAKLLGKTTSLLFVGGGLLCLLCVLAVNRRRISFPVVRSPKPLLEFALLGVFCAALAAQLVMSAGIHKFDMTDDGNYYLAAAKKVMQNHEFGADPFSERRAISTMGGGYFLDSLILGALPLEKVPMADRGLGFLLLWLLTYDIGLCFDLSRTQKYMFGILALAVIPDYYNATFVVLPMACVFAFPVVLSHPFLEESPVKKGLLLGILLAVVSACKSSNVVQAAAFLALAAAWMAWRKGFSQAVRIAVPALAAGVLILLPWCLTSWKYSGTAFYPLLGHGYDYTAYHQFRSSVPTDYRLVLYRIRFLIPALVVFAALEAFVMFGISAGECASLLTMTTILSVVALDVGARGFSTVRYNFQFLAASALLGLAACVPALRRAAGSRTNKRLTIARSALFCMGGIAVCASALYAPVWMPSHEGYAVPEAFHLPEEVHQEYAALNSVFPGCGRTLAAIRYTYLLDFSRSDIYLADFPGAAGPPNGWPFGGGSAARLKQYLAQNNIGCVAYSDLIIDQAHFDASLWVELRMDYTAWRNARKKLYSTWILDQCDAALAALEQFHQLSETQCHVLDRDDIHVIDLSRAKTDVGCGHSSLPDMTKHLQ